VQNFNPRAHARSYAEKVGVDPDVIDAIITQESGGRIDIKDSSAGAKGIMQLMPRTAKEVGVTDINDPVQNIEGGIRYFKQQQDRFGDDGLAFIAYNAGPARAQEWLDKGIVSKGNYENVPYKETREYVQKVNQNINKLKGGQGFSASQTTPKVSNEKPVISISDNTPYVKPDYSNEREELESERAAQLANRANILSTGMEERISRLSDIDENGLIGRYAMSDIFKPLSSLQPVVVSMPGKKATTKRRLSFNTSV
jgi:membrane-bound lytic murein transglycosylase MltF